MVKERIDVRISKEQKEFVRYASELRGFKNLSEFVLYCINSEASKIVKDNNIILESLEDKKIFIETLINPPAPNENLVKANLNYQNFMKKNGLSD